MFVTTHYMDEAEYGHRLALMNKGRIVALGTPRELKRDWMKDSVLDLECDDFMRAADILEKEDVFRETAIFGNLLHLVTSDPESASVRAREILLRSGISVTRLEPITPSLEDVFVTLTREDRA